MAWLRSLRSVLCLYHKSLRNPCVAFHQTEQYGLRKASTHGGWLRVGPQRGLRRRRRRRTGRVRFVVRVLVTGAEDQTGRVLPANLSHTLLTENTVARIFLFSSAAASCIPVLADKHIMYVYQIILTSAALVLHVPTTIARGCRGCCGRRSGRWLRRLSLSSSRDTGSCCCCGCTGLQLSALIGGRRGSLLLLRGY